MGRIKQPIRNRTKFFWAVVGVAILCAQYEWLSYRQHQRNPSDTTLPSFSQLWDGLAESVTPRENSLRAAFDDEQPKSFYEQAKKTWLFRDSVATYSRLAKGLFWGTAISVVLGIAMGCYEWIGALFLPSLAFLAKVPGTAMLAVFFVLVGTGEAMFVSMIAFGVLPTLTQAVYASAKYDVREEHINKSYTLGASNMEVIYEVVYKTTLPRLLESARLQIGPAMVYLIAAEYLVGSVGMGYQIRQQQKLIEMAVVYDYLLILGITGLLMDRGMLALRRWLCPWFNKYK